MKLKAAQEIMDSRNNAGRIELTMVKFVPVESHGVEQYIDNGNGYQLRAQIAERDWPEWVKNDPRARRAQEQDDDLPTGTIAQRANTAKLARPARRKAKRK